MLWRAVVRTDPMRGESIRANASFEASSRRAAEELASDSWGRESLSGHERNRLFWNDSGQQFRDISLLSGADHTGDGRSVAVLDIDRDGWLDIASVNANAPTLTLFHNRVAAIDDAADGNLIAFRFSGGNRESVPARGLSSRDGYGAQLTVHAAGRSILREHRCGEGFAAQQSDLLRVGIGAAEEATFEVRWPGGRRARYGPVRAGTLVTVSETGGPNGDGFVVEDSYLRRGPAPMPDAGGDGRLGTFLIPGELPGVAANARIRCHLLTATWCAACKSELPQLRRLRERLPPEQVAFIGIPGDPAETADLLRAEHSRTGAPYALVASLAAPLATRLEELRARHLRGQETTLPAFLVTDASGNVLEFATGSPTLSGLRQHLLDESHASGKGRETAD